MSQPGEMAQLSVRVPDGQAEALERIAEANDRSLSQELRRLIRIRISECEQRGHLDDSP